MRYASWSAGIALQLLAFIRPLVVFYAKKVNCLCFCERAHARARACRSHTRFCFCTAITDIIPYYKGYKGQESGQGASWFLENCHSFNLTFRLFSFVHMAIFVAFHLGKSQDGVLTLGAVVVGLLPIMGASPYRTKLRGSVFFEAGGHDGVQLLVLASVGHHFVGIRAIVVAFQTMEVAA